MSKIELSLESNIKLINASGMTGWKVNSKELEPLIIRISKNFYAPHAESLALECVRLWKATQDRDFVCSFLLIAYEVEKEWREKNKMRTLVKTIQSTYAFEQVPFNIITGLPDAVIEELHYKFKNMPYDEFLKTRYWNSVRLATLNHFGFTCQATVNGIPCGRQTDLQVHHRHYKNARGYEHENYKTDLVVCCAQHHYKIHLDETTKGNEFAREEVGQSGE